MNKNIIHSIIAAAMCLGVALSPTQVWAGTYFTCQPVSEKDAEFHCYWDNDYDFVGDITEVIIEELKLVGILPDDYEVVVGFNLDTDNNCLYAQGNLEKFEATIRVCKLTDNSVIIEVEEAGNTKRSYRWRKRCRAFFKRPPPGWAHCRARNGDRTGLKDCEEWVHE